MNGSIDKIIRSNASTGRSHFDLIDEMDWVPAILFMGIQQKISCFRINFHYSFIADICLPDFVLTHFLNYIAISPFRI